MTTLILRLSGPMQSWGTRSRFAYRYTDPHPSKSGVLGLLAAAQGRRRTDSIEDLLGLRFGVRKDQPGQVLRDFQTARSLNGQRAFPLTYRYYLADAVFVAGVEGDSALLEQLANALRRPRFPLFLGKRSCPPAGQLLLDVVPGGLESALEDAEGTGVEWQAATWWRRRQDRRVLVEVLRDAAVDEPSRSMVEDTPISFDPIHRRYATRAVVHRWVSFDNPQSRHAGVEHDPWSMWGGR